MLTMCPPCCSFITAMAASVAYRSPRTFTSNIWRHWSERPFSILESSITPALFTRMSTRPSSSLACRTRACAASSSVTSHSTESALPPLPLIRSTSSESRSFRRAATTTDAPSAANASAVASPMPLDAPVITATLPSSFATGNSFPSDCARKGTALAGSGNLAFGGAGEPEVSERPVRVVKGSQGARRHKQEGQEDQAGYHARPDCRGRVFRDGQEDGREEEDKPQQQDR